MSFEIVNPESLGEPRGWNNGLLAEPGGRVLFVAGQTDRAADGRIRSEGLVEQFAGALENVLAVVEAAGGRPEDIGRLTVYLTDLATYHAGLKPLGVAYRRLMGRHYPAVAVIEATGLVDEGALVELEATAVIPARPGPT